MSIYRFIALLAVTYPVSSGLGEALFAQESEKRVRWPFYKDVSIAPARDGLVDFLLDAEVLGSARRDHADLRVYDGRGREVPYALRVLRKEFRSDLYEASEYNRGSRDDIAEVFLDLGNYTTEHNEVSVLTAGENFRRRVQLAGSDDRSTWAGLEDRGLIFRFQSSRGGVDEDRVSYATARYRYLRVRVYPDTETDDGAPAITSVEVRRVIRVEGETVDFQAVSLTRDATRLRGRPASAYRIDFGHRVPVHAIVLDVTEEGFARPYQLDIMGREGQDDVHLASGQLVRRDQTSGELRIAFEERAARWFRLTVTDDRNAPLTILQATGRGAARQVVIEGQTATQAPLHLHFGNLDAAAPNYDFADSLPDVLSPTPRRVALGPRMANPAYEPAPKPLMERSPWLIYLVLAAASIALFLLLRSLTAAVEHPMDRENSARPRA